MHSISAAFKPKATAEPEQRNDPMQTVYIPNLQLNDGNEIPMVSRNGDATPLQATGNSNNETDSWGSARVPAR
jgi:hypothetical protein